MSASVTSRCFTVSILGKRPMFWFGDSGSDGLSMRQNAEDCVEAVFDTRVGDEIRRLQQTVVHQHVGLELAIRTIRKVKSDTVQNLQSSCSKYSLKTSKYC